MAIKDFIINEMQARHCLSLDNTTQEIDGVSTKTKTEIFDGNYTFVQEPVCYGVSYSVQTNQLDGNYSSTEKGAIMRRRKDINNASDGSDSTTYDWNTNEYTLNIWATSKTFETPTCIYEQGASYNNLAFLAGLGQTLTFQAADDKRPFLIAQAQFLPQADRPYLLTGIWQRYDHSDYDNNTIHFYINGVLQQTDSKATNTDKFPNHGGDLAIGNTADELRSYNSGKMKLAIRQTNANWFITSNKVSLSQDIIREFFERCVIPEYVIEGTLSDMQDQLDNLSGTTFQYKNCVFEIRQPSDVSGDFRLFVDNIKFIQDKWLRDISVQYVGPNKLTIENCNGADVEEISTPAEKDLDGGTTIIQGGGTIEILNKRIRYFDNAEIVNSQEDKLVIEGGDTYTLDGGTITEIENVSGNDVVVYLKNGAPIPTLIETSGTITIINNMYILFKNITENASLYVQDNQGNKYIYESDITGGNHLLTIPREYHGKTFKAVVKKPGYNHQLSEFTINEGAYVEINVNLSKRLNADGTDMYLGTDNDLVDIAFDDINQANIKIGDGYAPLQATFDETETALVSEAGMKWLVNIGSVCSQFNSAGGDYLFMGTKWRLQRRNSGDGNATLNAFAMSADGVPVDDSNGDVKYLTSDSPTAIAKAVWAEMVENNNVEGTFGELVKNQALDHITMNKNIQDTSMIIPALRKLLDEL